MSVKEDLDIFLITYNRAEKLKQTLEQLYAFNSPIRDFHITILDNASTDNTAEICKDYTQQFLNTKYLRNDINVGVSGNIIKTMEFAHRKWLWILCDDDNYNWDAWQEIENALTKDYDVVMTGYTDGFRSEEYPYLINEMAFIPQAIYNTKNINQEVMNNAYGLSVTGFVQHALGCKVLNENGNIFVPLHKLVIQTYEGKNQGIRGLYKPNLYHKLGNFNLIYGYIEAYSLIEDMSLREKCFDILCLGQSFETSLDYLESMGVKPFQYFDIFMALDKRHKERFIRYYLKKNIFSITNAGNHKKITICFIKYKFRRRGNNE